MIGRIVLIVAGGLALIAVIFVVIALGSAVLGGTAAAVSNASGNIRNGIAGLGDGFELPSAYDRQAAAEARKTDRFVDGLDTQAAALDGAVDRAKAAALHEENMRKARAIGEAECYQINPSATTCNIGTGASGRMPVTPRYGVTTTPTPIK